MGWELSHSSLGWMGAGGMGVEEKVRSTVLRMSGWTWAITTTLMALTRCLKKIFDLLLYLAVPGLRCSTWHLRCRTWASLEA